MDFIYLDHAATTPLRPEVREAMAPYLDEAFGNPSSAHRWGRQAAAALEGARASVAATLGARPPEVHFTRGGTESDNLAIFGRARLPRPGGGRPSIVHSAVEHHAVLEAARWEEALGVRRRVLAVDPTGRLDLDALDQALEDLPAVVSVMWVNNEVGMVLPVPEVAERCQARGVPLHTDAVQAVGKVPVRVDDVPVALLTVTGHKIYGPKSTGVLFVREGTELAPLLHGGGQERGVRPGTQDVAGAVGLAEALALAVAERESEAARLGGLRDGLEAALRARLPSLVVHGGGAPRAPHVVNVGIPGIDGAALVAALDLDGVAVSGGSACASGATTASHVLEALFGPAVGTRAALRFSLGRGTLPEHVERAVEATVRAVERMSPA
ncbi:MAG TPA: cysteine desulfurase family protein [Longimicrobiales bacterium]